MRIAVAGNPNCGKSTLFNALTGARAHVGNYPGITVERKEAVARLPGGTTARLIDLPGCYSLTARSPEEEVAQGVLAGWYGDGRPDVVVCVVDVTQLARGLYLVLQLLELGIPVVLALSMMDVARQRHVRVDVGLLAERLAVPVVPVSAPHNEGLTELMQAVQACAQRRTPVLLATLGPDDTAAIEAVRAAEHGLDGSVGNCLWLLSSDLERVRVPLSPPTLAAIRAQRARLDPDGTGAFNRRLIAARYAAVDALLHNALDAGAQNVGATDRLTRRLDRVLLHPVLGLAVFAGTMFVLFQAVFAWAEPLMNGIEKGMGALADVAEHVIPGGHTQSLVVHGIIAGVGNVLAFLPQIALLFLGITLLEESGYMARAAFLLDRLMRRAGLHGKAFIPLMSSFACAVPGIMAARTVENSRDRLVTILVAPFMSCSARLPVYTLVIAAVFANAPPLFGVLSVGGVTICAMYLLGFTAALTSAWLLKRTVLRSPLPPLLLELPMYRAPRPAAVLRRVGERCLVFVRETGTTILALSVLLWGILTFPQSDPPATFADSAQLETPARHAAPLHASLHGPQADETAVQEQRNLRAYRLEHSLGGRLGHLIEPAIAPLGFDWRIGIGLVASFAAREVLVSTLGQVYALDAETAPDAPSLRQALRADLDPRTGQPRFTPLRGLSLMVFFVLALQCLSTVAVVRRETGGWKWAIIQLVFMNALAYVASLIVYQGGLALGFT